MFVTRRSSLTKIVVWPSLRSSPASFTRAPLRPVSTQPQQSSPSPNEPVKPTDVLPARKTLISRFLPQLERLSQRTNVPITSLAFSFALLHELTALLPLVILFFVFQTIGAGSAIVQWVGGVSADREAQLQGFDWRGRVGSWLEEGERRAEKVGRRYGIFGFEKGSQVEQNKSDIVQERKGMRAAGSVTNAVAAYVVVKALLPARIGLSLWAAPGFARFAVEPIRRAAFRWKIAAGTSSTRPR